MKYNELLKENKTLQRKIEELKLENEQKLGFINKLNKEISELKIENIKLNKQNKNLLTELKENKNPVSELIKISKDFNIF